jgi:hypothetical protein
LPPPIPYERFGLVFAHIAGIPVEETLLSFAPVLAATGGVAGLSWLRRPRKGPGRRRDKRER